MSMTRSISDTAADLLAGVLFVGFVGLLFWGYLFPGTPFSVLSALPFVGSLVTLFWANVSSDRRSCVVPMAPDPPEPSP